MIWDERTVMVREMKASDLQAVWELEKNCFSDAWSMKLLADALENDFDYFVVSESDGVVTGYANLRILAGEGEIERIAVDEKYRRSGHGRELMDAMELIASKAGVRDITLEVREHNMAARKLYESCGFAEEGRRRSYYRNPTEDAIIMWRHGA